MAIRKIGILGEQLAKDYLLTLGYRMIAQNYRCQLGEIDLIMQDEDDLVFIEVKTRRSLTYGALEETISCSKRKKIHLLAAYYLQQIKEPETICRFDAILIRLKPDASLLEMKHLKQAF